jgi:hypothetical protein
VYRLLNCEIVPLSKWSFSQSVNGEKFVFIRWPQLHCDSAKTSGERGRNRTYNLLILNQKPQTNGFNGFPSVLVVTSRQI